MSSNDKKGPAAGDHVRVALGDHVRVGPPDRWYPDPMDCEYLGPENLLDCSDYTLYLAASAIAAGYAVMFGLRLGSLTTDPLPHVIVCRWENDRWEEFDPTDDLFGTWMRERELEREIDRWETDGGTPR